MRLSPARPGLLALIGLAVCAGCAQTGGDQSAAAPAAPQPASVMNVADAAISGGDPSMALKVSQSVLATDPHNLDALYHEGAAYYAMNRCMDSIAVYQVALTVDPKSAEAEVGIGRCLLRRNAMEAQQAFTLAVQDDPNNAAALNDLGISMDLQGNHAGAVRPYQQALLLKPGELSTEVNLGMSLALSGDGDDALQYLGPLAASPEATPKIRQDYAAALVADGRANEARSVLAIDLPPDGVNQLLADFAAAIAAGQPPPSTAAPAPAPTATVPMAPAPVQSTPLAGTSPAAAPAPAAPAPAMAAATPAPAPVVVTAPATPVQTAAAPAAAAPAAMPPSAIPTASMAASPDDAGVTDAPPSTPAPVTPPPGASATSKPPTTAAVDKIVR